MDRKGNGGSPRPPLSFISFHFISMSSRASAAPARVKLIQSNISQYEAKINKLKQKKNEMSRNKSPLVDHNNLSNLYHESLTILNNSNVAANGHASNDHYSTTLASLNNRGHLAVEILYDSNYDPGVSNLSAPFASAGTLLQGEFNEEESANSFQVAKAQWISSITNINSATDPVSSNDLVPRSQLICANCYKQYSMVNNDNRYYSSVFNKNLCSAGCLTTYQSKNRLRCNLCNFPAYLSQGSIIDNKFLCNKCIEAA
jgi:hypothetical protein